MSTTHDVVILGAGAGGLMCALTAGQRGRRVLVLDRANRVGKKILMSGGGRCNFTNTGTRPEHFLSANPHFCKSALARFSPADFVDMVDRRAIAWHEKELGQLFCDDSAKQIVAMLVDECAAAGVDIRIGCETGDVAAADGGGFTLRTSHGAFGGASLVVATGGLSIPSLGGSGYGYQLARQFGHEVLETRAGLVPLTLTGAHAERLQDLSGVALPVEATANGQSFRNAMLLTHRGVSGPAILQLSSYWQPGDALHVDLLPGTDAAAHLRAQRAARPATELRTVLADVVPRRLAQRLCEHWLGDGPMRRFSDRELDVVATQLRAWPLVASGTEGYRTAEVTMGGVDTRQLSSSTMMSRLQHGLFFIGEVVDVTGWLGGYNFQWAWASGRAAGFVA